MVTISLFIRGLFDGKNEHKNLVHAEAATVETTKITTKFNFQKRGKLILFYTAINKSEYKGKGTCASGAVFGKKEK